MSILHNIVHLLFDIDGLALARTVNGARNHLTIGGALYLVPWLYGLLIDPDSSANFIPLNTGDHWLHFVLGAGVIALGFLLTRSTGVPRQG